MRPDDDLVNAVKNGDREALAILFERHRDFVFRIGLGLTGLREEAADIVQETFLALLQHAHALDTARGRITTWLFEVARRRASDRSRRRRVELAHASSILDGSADTPEELAAGSERREALHRAVASLPSRQREVFVLRIGLGLTVEETARWLGCAPGAVRTALYEANRRLTERLSEGTKGGSSARRLSPSVE